MASVNLSRLPSPLQLGSRSRSVKLPSLLAPGSSRAVPCISVNQKFKKSVAFQPRQGLFIAFASNSNPSGEDSRGAKSDGSAGQDPPLLTILAGFFVFLILLWVLGSILTWLIGLVAKLLQSK